MINSVRVVIAGRVQGVGYRAWTVSNTARLGLRGWVRNRNDGTVEAVFCGEQDAIDAMIEACKKGPTAARVDRIETYVWKEEIDEGIFSARPTV